MNKSASLENAENAANGSNTSGSNSEQQIKDPNLAGRIVELQNVLEKQSHELAEARVRCGEAQTKLREAEERHVASDDKLKGEINSQSELIKRLQRELKEATQMRDEQEQRVANLDQRYGGLQREYTQCIDQIGRLETEIALKENGLKNAEERLKSLQLKYEASEQRCDQLLSKQNQLNSSINGLSDVNGNPDRLSSTVGGGYGDAMAKSIAFAQFQEKNFNNEERLHSLQSELEDVKMELNRAQQREKLSEDHNTRLTQTIDKLLNDSNERLQLHLNERMHALEEKNQLSSEVDRLKKQVEEIESERVRILAIYSLLSSVLGQFFFMILT